MLADAREVYGQRAIERNRAGNDGITLLLSDRSRFSRDERFID